MKILSIETSCDETAVSIVEIKGKSKSPQIKILADNILSQVKIHAEYGGVFPMVAKREHSRALIPLLEKSLKEAKLSHFVKTSRDKEKNNLTSVQEKKLNKLLEREPELLEKFLNYIPTIAIPKIDAIAVTQGPGLEPALWVGLNFAKALSLIWNKNLIPVNHMEGHIMASLFDNTLCRSSLKNDGQGKISTVKFPALALLISGGHTELVLMKDWQKYKIIGQTRDDALGEAFDKVARMLGLPYPGGPQISKLAKESRSLRPGLGHSKGLALGFKFPRPMINSDDFDFSFSGLKTAVLYFLKKNPSTTLRARKEVAREFEDAVTEVLVKKTKRAIEKFSAKTLIVGGGVSANDYIRDQFAKNIEIKTYFPKKNLSTDNSVMIALAGYLGSAKKTKNTSKLKAEGNMVLK